MKIDPYHTLRDASKEFSKSAVAMDEAHAMLIYGMVLAHKPIKVVEFGLGSGSLTRILLAAIKYNNVGSLLTVDNFFDWQGKRPPEADRCLVFAADNHLEDRFEVREQDQEEFLKSGSDSTYQLMICDANHGSEPWLLDHMARLTVPGGWIFVHDASHDLWKRNTADLKPFHHTFDRISLSHERNDRGLMMIFNEK